MSIPDDALLDEFRQPGHCEFCGYLCRNGREPSHTFTKGTGGGQQMDIPANLTSLCGPFQGACHARHHNGQSPTTKELISTTASRLRVTYADVLAELYRARRMVKPTEYECPFTHRKWTRVV